MTTFLTCPLCHEKQACSLTHGMARCPDCHFFFLQKSERAAQQASYHAQSEQPVDPDLLSRLKKKYPKDKHDKRALYEHYAALVFGWYGSSIRALDVGANGGFFLNAVERCGATPGNLETTEVIPAYIQLTKDYFGYEGGIGNIETYQPGRTYNLITMFDVLEHVDDFWAALANIHSLLKPEGRLLLKLPNGRFAYTKYRMAKLLGRSAEIPRYLHIRPGGHLNYWDVSSITRLEAAGFMVDRFEYVQPTKAQFRGGYRLRAAAFWLNAKLGTHLFPEMIVVLKKR